MYKGLEQDDLVVCAPEEGIFLSMQALLEPGDHVVVTFPGYQSLHQIAQSIGCQVSKWEPDEAAGWRFDLSELEALLRPETKLVVVNFPHNPTGFVPSKPDFESLVDLVRERGVYLFSDEMYRYLDVVEGTSLPSACELYERAISLFGMSKSFGLPGLRIGWVGSQDQDVIQRILTLKDYTTICSSAPSEVLAIIALQNRESIISRQKLRVKDNLQTLDIFMDRYAEIFSWNKPIGGSICFPRMLRVQSTLNFCDRLVAATGIMLVPSAMFQYGDKHVRIGIGRDNFQEVLAMFGEYLDKLFWMGEMKIKRFVVFSVGFLVFVVLFVAVMFSWLHKTNGKIESSGQTRTYLLYIPESYQPETPTPWSSAYMGLQNGRPTRWISADGTGLRKSMDLSSFIPQGQISHCAGILMVYLVMDVDPWMDVVYISDLIDKLQDEYNIDPAAGVCQWFIEWGRDVLCPGLQIGRSHRGYRDSGWGLFLPCEDCSPSRPVPVIAFHGTADRIVPYDGGDVSSTGYQFPPVQDWVRGWALRNGCDMDPLGLPSNGEVSGIRYSGCRSNADVHFYTIQGGGHSWPGGEPMPEIYRWAHQPGY